jgi:hypothetical protein
VILLVIASLGYLSWLPLNLAMPIRDAQWVMVSFWFPTTTLLTLLLASHLPSSWLRWPRNAANWSSAPGAEDAAEAVRRAFAKAGALVDGLPVSATVSIGPAWESGIGGDLNALFRRADAALYVAKRAWPQSGGNARPPPPIPWPKSRRQASHPSLISTRRSRPSSEPEPELEAAVWG